MLQEKIRNQAVREIKRLIDEITNLCFVRLEKLPGYYPTSRTSDSYYMNQCKYLLVEIAKMARANEYDLGRMSKDEFPKLTELIEKAELEIETEILKNLNKESE